MKEKIKKRRLVLPIFIIIIMSFSILSFSFLDRNSNEKTIKYKDKKFTLVNSLWVTYIDGKELVIVNDPNYLDDVNLEGYNLKYINKVYLSKDPKYNLNNELGILLGIRSFLNIIFVDSCFEDLEGCENLPLTKCEDATFNIGVIEISINNTNYVKRNGSCLKITGDSDFIVKIIDKIVLETLL